MTNCISQNVKVSPGIHLNILYMKILCLRHKTAEESDKFA